MKTILKAVIQVHTQTPSLSGESLYLHGTSDLAMPYVVYQPLEGRRERNFAGGHEIQPIQFDIYGRTETEVIDLTELLLAAYDETEVTIDGTPVYFGRQATPHLLKTSQNAWRSSVDYRVIVG